MFLQLRSFALDIKRRDAGAYDRLLVHTRRTISILNVTPARAYGNAIVLNLAHIEYLTEHNHPVIAMLRREPWMLDEESGEAMLSQLARTSAQKQRQTETEALREQFLDLGSKKDVLKNLWDVTATGNGHQLHKDVSKGNAAQVMRLRLHLVDIVRDLTKDDTAFRMYFDDDPPILTVKNRGCWGEDKYQRIRPKIAVLEQGHAEPFFSKSFAVSTAAHRKYNQKTWFDSNQQKYHDQYAAFAGQW